MIATDTAQPGSGARRILGRLAPENFVGRADDLRALTDLALPAHETRGLIMLAAPAAGVSELLRQAYDRLFRQRGGATPIYFRPGAICLSRLNSATTKRQGVAEHITKT